MWRILFLLAVATLAASLRYDGYHQLDVGPLRSHKEVDIVNQLRKYEGSRKIVFLNDEVLTKKSPLSMAVHPNLVRRVIKMMNMADIPVAISVVDIQKHFDAVNAQNEVIRQATKAKAAVEGRAPTPNYYMTFDEMTAWIEQIASEHTDTSIFSIGLSHDFREMKGLAINDNSSLPLVWIDGGIHAREWISPSTALWIIHTLLTSSDSNAQRLRSSYKWNIVPSINPDGYEWTITDDRLWRKNRAPHPGTGCIGTDLNRNWDFEFAGAGTSDDPCSDTFHGDIEFSQEETQRARDAINARASTMLVYIGMHSYSQFMLLPWGGRSIKPADYAEIEAAGIVATTAIENTNGRVWDVGTPPDILYVATGGAFDYVKETSGVKWVFTPELRPDNGAGNGFVLPATDIQPGGTEMWNGVVALLDHIAANP